MLFFHRQALKDLGQPTIIDFFDCAIRFLSPRKREKRSSTPLELHSRICLIFWNGKRERERTYRDFSRFYRKRCRSNILSDSLMNFRKVEKFFFLSFIARVFKNLLFWGFCGICGISFFIFYFFIFLVINYKNLPQDFENSLVSLYDWNFFFSSCLSSGILILVNNSGISVPRMKFRFTEMFLSYVLILHVIGGACFLMFEEI